MDLTIKAISKHSKLIEGLEGYSILVKKIQDNVNINPDISIESCKSILEGICKKALMLLSDKYRTEKKMRKECDNKLPFLVKTAFALVYKSSLEVEIHHSFYSLIYKHQLGLRFRNKIERLVKENSKSVLKDLEKAVVKISVLRDNRGDISHGRIYPKSEESELHLAKSIVAFTDGICSYMIEEMARQYFDYKQKEGKLKYEELSMFNEWLDTKFNVIATKLDYSNMIFKSAPEKYEDIYYGEYQDYLEGQHPDTEEVPDGLQLEKPKRKNLEKSVVDKDLQWSDFQLAMLNRFATIEKLKGEKLKKILEDFLFSELPPLRDDVIELMNNKPGLNNRRKLAEDLIRKIMELAKDLEK